MENNQKKVLKVHLEELKKGYVISGPLGQGKVHITFIDRKTDGSRLADMTIPNIFFLQVHPDVIFIKA